MIQYHKGRDKNMYTKAELLNLYNMDLDSLLNESKKYLKDEVEFCSIINIAHKVHITTQKSSLIR